MENASKALLMAGSILIGIMVISVSVYIFNVFSNYSKERSEELNAHQLSEFNAQFTKYEAIEQISIYQIISVANYAKNHNESMAKTGDTTTQITVTATGTLIGSNKNITNLTTEEKNELIKNHVEASSIPMYRIKDGGITYNVGTKRVNSVQFEQIP